jgi:L-alanine-DL-glutamate epimerase-like enolase superfamily enzyme
MSIKINSAQSNFEREPLIRPFGFKGGNMDEIWQTAVKFNCESGAHKIGLGTQNALWSDANVFADRSSNAAEAAMYLMSDYAAQLLVGQSFENPVELLDEILEDVYAFGVRVTGNKNLRKTFALNALVAVDNAAWLLYAAENKITRFDDLIPKEYRPALSFHHQHVASIPLMAYGIPVDEIVSAVNDGYFFMKIKIGQPGTQAEMLKKDKARISEIHNAIGHQETPHTENGKLPYYFDANGRYENKETLMRLIDHADKIGALEQIAIIEEPFPEEYEEPVDDVPVRIAADESAHTDADALKRIQLGYGAMALKAIAKTLSMTLKVAAVAHQHNIPCFCADLTVNPLLVDWNKNIAARLAPFPGLQNMGLLETNGHQNYRNWDRMQNQHPFVGAEWMKTKSGLFHCDNDFYENSGGMFKISEHYEKMFKLEFK